MNFQLTLRCFIILINIMHMASTPRTVITNILGLISLLMAIGTIVLFGFNTLLNQLSRLQLQ